MRTSTPYAPAPRIYMPALIPALLLLGVFSCNQKPRSNTVPKPGGSGYPVSINEPRSLRGVSIGVPGSAPERISCAGCHSLRAAKPLPKSMGEFSEFHLGLSLNHGNLTCDACHSVGQPPALHLADGKRLDMADALTLCAQCHGPQYRDYQRGSHGGMQGHWDLAQGPRNRNHCVDCHAPHAPQQQQVHPAPRPRDRFFLTGDVR